MTRTHDADTREHSQSARPYPERRGLDAAREHREDLEALVETDLPASTWAQRLLDILDEQETGGGGR